jgi:hypothetical protein
MMSSGSKGLTHTVIREQRLISCCTTSSFMFRIYLWDQDLPQCQPWWPVWPPLWCSLFATFFAFRKSVAVSGDPQTDKNKNYVHSNTKNLKKCKKYKILPKIAFSQMAFCFEILVLCPCKLILMLLTSTCRGCMTEVAKYAMHSYMFLHVYNAYHGNSFKWYHYHPYEAVPLKEERNWRDGSDLWKIKTCRNTPVEPCCTTGGSVSAIWNIFTTKNKANLKQLKGWDVQRTLYGSLHGMFVGE